MKSRQRHWKCSTSQYWGFSRYLNHLIFITIITTIDHCGLLVSWVMIYIQHACSVIVIKYSQCYSCNSFLQVSRDLRTCKEKWNIFRLQHWFNKNWRVRAHARVHAWASYISSICCQCNWQLSRGFKLNFEADGSTADLWSFGLEFKQRLQAPWSNIACICFRHKEGWFSFF